jgi:hypothetical protein
MRVGAGVKAVATAICRREEHPIVDKAWVHYFPEGTGLIGERIPMQRIGGSPIAVPLPQTRHLNAHMRGGVRNPGGLALSPRSVRRNLSDRYDNDQP